MENLEMFPLREFIFFMLCRLVMASALEATSIQTFEISETCKFRKPCLEHSSLVQRGYQDSARLLGESWDNVSGFFNMGGQRNNSTAACRFVYDGTSNLTWKILVPGPGTIMISPHELPINRKSKWPFVSKLIPGELPAHDASVCIWKHFRYDFVDSATVTSLPTVSQPALLLPRGVNGNTQLVPVTRCWWHVITKIFGFRTLLTS